MRAPKMVIFQPETVKAIGKGFDAAWACIANNFRGDPDEIKAGRRALAIAVLSVVGEGSRDVEVLKNAALQAMALEYRGKLRRSL